GGIEALFTVTLGSPKRDFLGFLREVQGRDGVLAHGLLILLVQLGILVLDYLAHAELGQFLRHQLGIEQAALDRGLVLYEGGNDLVQVLLADALRLHALRLDKALDLDLELAGFLVEADIGLIGIVPAFTVIKAWRRAALRVL